MSQSHMFRYFCLGTPFDENVVKSIVVGQILDLTQDVKD
jgi:hypothetical protein